MTFQRIIVSKETRWNLDADVSGRVVSFLRPHVTHRAVVQVPDYREG